MASELVFFVAQWVLEEITGKERRRFACVIHILKLWIDCPSKICDLACFGFASDAAASDEKIVLAKASRIIKFEPRKSRALIRRCERVPSRIAQNLLVSGDLFRVSFAIDLLL